MINTTIHYEVKTDDNIFCFDNIAFASIYHDIVGGELNEVGTIVTVINRKSTPIINNPQDNNVVNLTAA